MRRAAALALAVAAAASGAGCGREARLFHRVPGGTPRPTLAPAATAGEAAGPYDANAWALSQGKTLYGWYNCNGCHAHGGGGMGPPLIDAEWRYGSRPEQIFETIAKGRPQGMPAFGGRIPEDQIWMLVAYVRSMSGHVRHDAAPGRSDAAHTMEPELLREPVPWRDAGASP